MLVRIPDVSVLQLGSFELFCNTHSPTLRYRYVNGGYNACIGVFIQFLMKYEVLIVNLFKYNTYITILNLVLDDNLKASIEYDSYLTFNTFTTKNLFFPHTIREF